MFDERRKFLERKDWQRLGNWHLEMLVFTLKISTLEGKEVRLSKYKAPQPRKLSSQQLKPTHWVLASKPYRGWCFSLGKLWQKAAWPLAVLQGSCSGVVQVSLRVALLQLAAGSSNSLKQVFLQSPSPCTFTLSSLPPIPPRDLPTGRAICF